jgi:hypothetical protein
MKTRRKPGMAAERISQKKHRRRGRYSFCGFHLLENYFIKIIFLI